MTVRSIHAQNGQQLAGMHLVKSLVNGEQFEDSPSSSSPTLTLLDGDTQRISEPFPHEAGELSQASSISPINLSATLLSKFIAAFNESEIYKLAERIE